LRCTEPREVIANRKWWYRLDPFPHFVAGEVFAEQFAAALQDAFGELLARGCSEHYEDARLSHNMQHSDAYGWDFPADIDGPLGFFYSSAWLDVLMRITGIEATRDVNAALHHHPPGSAHGRVHRDLNIGWFSDQPRADGVNPMDLRRCSYTNGRQFAPDAQPRQTVRAATMIYFLANSTWRSGDGGETGLYRCGSDAVTSPAAAIAPVNNSLLVFENGPRSYHSFMRNLHRPRNSIILWLHRSVEQTSQRWGRKAIGRLCLTSAAHRHDPAAALNHSSAPNRA
jgi:hypothetical protein